MRRFENRIGDQYLTPAAPWPQGPTLSNLQKDAEKLLVAQNAVKFANDSYNVHQAPAGIRYHPRTFKDWSPEANLLR